MDTENDMLTMTLAPRNGPCCVCEDGEFPATAAYAQVRAFSGDTVTVTAHLACLKKKVAEVTHAQPRPQPMDLTPQEARGADYFMNALKHPEEVMAASVQSTLEEFEERIRALEDEAEKRRHKEAWDNMEAEQATRE